VKYQDDVAISDGERVAIGFADLAQ